jgi:hypothetical protein
VKLHTGTYWPSPEDWQKILGPETTERLMADAEEIIRTGQQHDFREPRKRSSERNG